MENFVELTAAHLADACLRAKIELRCAALYPALAGTRMMGAVRPVRHYGSVDVFLEAIDAAAPGDALVVDNEGRRDEGCIGDLVALEALNAGIVGIVIWGCHRDTAEIRTIGLPVFSLGAIAAGPTRLEPRRSETFSSATVAGFSVSRADVVMGDDDGVLFIPKEKLAEIASAGNRIREVERGQAERARGGVALREQLRFAEYLQKRETDPDLTFRQHLQNIGGAIEE
jgi:4-hydroxy-4-methyl-2-oxoglutarate aldolase